MGITLPAEVRAGSTVLLQSPSASGPVEEASIRFLAGDEPRRTEVVALTFDRSATAFIDTWIDQVGVKPADIRVIDVGTDARSVASGSAESTPTPNVVRSVEDPMDLAAVRTHLVELTAESTGSRESRIVYLDSLPGQLGKTRPLAATMFLHDVVGIVRQTESVGFARVDRTSHSGFAIAAMRSLVDVTLAFDGGTDSWSVVDGKRTGGVTARLATDDLFDLLSNRRRRLALHVLGEAAEPVDTLDLATKIAGIEPSGDDSLHGETLERIYTGLVHVHLPKLETHGVVSVDEDDGTVRIRGPAERLESLLALTVVDDLHG